MKTLQAQVPELLLREVQELAENQNATVDQIVSVTFVRVLRRGVRPRPERPHSI